MQIEISYPKEFDRLWTKMKAEYPKEMFQIEGVGDQLDFNSFSKKFFTNSTTTADSSVDPNANVSDKSVGSFANEMVKPYKKLDSYYMLWKYAKREFGARVANSMIKAQISGDLYINDLHGFSSGKSYCFNYSTYDIATKGLPMIDKIKSSPPKYLYAFKSQVEQFVTIASNSTLGATGLADLLLVSSFYVEDILDKCGDAHFKFRSQEDCWIYIRETFASMIYTLNQPMRVSQSPFTNISIFDDVFLRKLSPDYIHPTKGTPLNIQVVKQIQVLYMDLMNKELERTPITFPVVSACHSKDLNNNLKDENFLDLIAEKNLQFGFMNMFKGKSSLLSSCCRLRSDVENEYFNSFGAGSSKIGSLGVVTTNYARLGFKWGKDKTKLFSEIKRLVTLSFKINYIRRLIVEKRIKSGHQPLYSFGFIDINKQYLTQGVNGFNELIELSNKDPLSEEGVNLGIDVIKAVNLTNNKLGKKYKVPVNVEQIPAENTSIKFAQKDKLLGINKGEYDLYSNQFIPLITKADMLDRITLQGKYDDHFSGGSICHLNIENQITDKEKLKDLIRLSAKQGVIYTAVNYNLQECSNGHLTVGKKEICPICNSPIESNYTKVVGFLTNTKNWAKERRDLDYPNRQFYKSI